MNLDTATYEEMLKECAWHGSRVSQELLDRVAIIQEVEKGGIREEVLLRLRTRRLRWGSGSLEADYQQRMALAYDGFERWRDAAGGAP